MDYVTDGGLLVRDRRHHRAATEEPQVDPRSHDPNPNTSRSSVGPATKGGEVMGPLGHLHADAWDGWPDQWMTPYGATSGFDVMAKRTSTAMTCVDLNSRQIASFPVYGMRGAEPTTLPTWSTNPEPAIYDSWPDFMHGVVNAMEIRGHAFQYATSRLSNGYPGSFVNLNPDSVRVEWIDGAKEYLVEGVPVDARDMCHVKYQSWPGRLEGIGPLEWAARSLATAASLERYAANLSTRGGVPWAVLKAQRNIDGTQATEVQDRWVTAAARRDGAPAVIGNAFELEPLSFSPEQMALLGLREFDERRICAAFGVPGYLVNVAMADGLTYANASQLFAHHWTATLRPLAGLIAAAWSSWLLPHGTSMEFNPDRYVQPPFGERVAGYQTMFNLQDPVTGRRGMEMEEIRGAERLPVGGVEDGAAVVQRLTGGNNTK